MPRRFTQVDVFSDEPLLGNPVAVVLDGEGLDDAALQRFAAWTNLSETTFVLPPAREGADYRVRIFTPSEELPFAGHPTLGTCHVWLEAGGAPQGEEIVQDCGLGLVPIRRVDGRLAFAAPPPLRSGTPAEADVARVCGEVGVAREQVVDAAWADNGPGWLALLLDSPESVRAARPGAIEHSVGLVALGGETDVELRAFFPVNGITLEDPVTGSLNAAVAQWLLSTGRVAAPYVAAQGAALGRRGRVHVSTADGETWIGGATTTVLRGSW